MSAPVQAIDRPTLEQIEARLQKSPNMLGRFEQKKTLPQLPRPLLSNGVVALSEDRGVSWRVLEPIGSHRIFDGEGRDPMAKQIAYPLMQIFRGNFAALEELFQVDAQLLESGWQVTLIPKGDALAGFVQSIEVSGNGDIEKLRLAETNQAITEMRLIGLQAVDEQDPKFAAEFASEPQE
ncbi:MULTISPECIES: outer membrane lipoprotein carrier protein LolA [unclassified Microbulbifer]|uniref:outer membrane lipoprotein carrier protein LolA n=1 Tax=unclassified Microbulbifer TaxID=2619833 RepID=UPI0027E467B0|nr:MULTISPECIES: outer membrane lipoprotein carrier protein LolA [unclassified Microbulbifer]